jgi:hypothetical protein
MGGKAGLPIRLEKIAGFVQTIFAGFRPLIKGLASAVSCDHEIFRAGKPEAYTESQASIAHVGRGITINGQASTLPMLAGRRSL